MKMLILIRVFMARVIISYVVYTGPKPQVLRDIINDGFFLGVVLDIIKELKLPSDRIIAQ